ncbi:MAG TPA: caspase family protein [Polyangia bacterium]|nr:caspase family protein [Polyangia bacterium]
MNARAARTLAAAGALIVSLAGAAAAHAQPGRVALVIANDEGHAEDVKLHFAESDADHLARVLTQLGGFEPDSTFVLRGRSVADVRRALGDVGRRLREAPGEPLLFVYYSGHADAEGLHIGRESLSLVELKAAVLALPAAARVVVVDACQAGAITRLKGGHAATPFAVAPEEAPRGLAILASSGDAELAQESDDIGSSFFTHYLLLGLQGAADDNRDGDVSLGEAFDFASRRTLAATMGSAAGPQHPMYRLDLRGQKELVLTRPGLAGSGFGRLALDEPGWFFVRRAGDAGVMEVVSGGREQIALEPGRYEVASRLPDRLQVAEVDIRSDAAASLAAAPSRRVAFGRVVRKGGGVRPLSFGLAALAGARSDVADLGAAWTGAVAARVDAPAASFELRVGADRAELPASSAIGAPSVATTAAFASLAALRAKDLRYVTVAAGLEAGVVRFSERFASDTTARASLGATVGPTALVELPLGPRFCLRADAALPVYLLRERQSGGGDEVHARFAGRVSAGAGVYF